jgi:hypothetical protein
MAMEVCRYPALLNMSDSILRLPVTKRLSPFPHRLDISLATAMPGNRWPPVPPPVMMRRTSF